MCSSGPCERRFNLRLKETFNKGARAIIHSNCLLPVLSDGWIEIPCYLFRMFWRLSLNCGDDCCAPGGEDFTRPADADYPQILTRSSISLSLLTRTLRVDTSGAGRGNGRFVLSRLDFPVSANSIPVI